MTSLTDFLLARIAEDEAAAKYAEANLAHINSVGPRVVPIEVYSPARVLAECEAKRRIVEMHAPDEKYRHLWETDACTVCKVESPCPTLRALALPHADHPDYREEWKP